MHLALRGAMGDLRFSLRQLVKAPGFTTIAVLTLALGIGACAAIFSVAKAVLLRPLPIRDPDRVVAIEEILPGTNATSVGTGKYLAWKSQASSFSSIGALTGQSYNLTGLGEPEHLVGARITASLLPTLQVAPALGRNFLPEEEGPWGQETVAILGHGLWQRQFGGRPDVLGQTIQLSGKSLTVVGVMPPETGLPEPLQVFTPRGFSEQERRAYAFRHVQVYGRLAPGRTVIQAHGELAAIIERRIREDGLPLALASGWTLGVTPILDSIVGNVRPVLVSLMGAVGFLLLLACANVASLLLARATARRTEIAVRAALGATRGRIVRQLLVESLVLAAAGGALGVVLAEVGLRALLALAPEALPRAAGTSVDGGALAVAAAVALLSAAAFGLVPALQAARATLAPTLRQSARNASPEGSRQRLRSALVIGQVAIALILLTGAGLLMRSFDRLQAVSPGFEPYGAVVASTFLPRPQYTNDAQYVAFSRQILAEVAAAQGVVAVAVANNLPFSSHHLTFSMTARLARPGDAAVRADERPIANISNISPGYFRAMGIPLLRGRSFDGREGPSGPPAMVVSQSVVNRLFPGQDALGKSLSVGGPPREIVGIVPDVKQSSLQVSGAMQVYLSFEQNPDNDMIFVVRTDGRASSERAAVAALRQAAARADRQLPVFDVRPLSALVGSSLARQQFSTTVFTVFSVAALVLATIGIYGVIAYSVARRTGEFGIRMALGAQASHVLGLVLAQGGRLIALGAVLGVAGALLLGRSMTALLYGVTAHDPLTFAAVVVLFAVVAGAACLLPARRAARESPMTALRSE
jgi:putative ABC transport system permease protein